MSSVGGIDGVSVVPSDAAALLRDSTMVESGDLQLAVKLPEAQEVDDDEYSRRQASARADKLVREARTRAEHQLAARSTMLDLMEALQLMTQQRRDLERLLALEKNKSPALQARVTYLEEQLEEAAEAEEKRMADDLRKKALSMGNSMVFNMLLSKSRDGFESSFQKVEVPEHSDADEDEDADDASGTFTMSRRSSTKPRPTSLGDLVTAKVGDKVTLKWAMTLWLKVAHSELEAKRLEDAEAALRRAAEEQVRLLELAREEGREEVRKQMQLVEEKLKQEKEKTKELEAKIKDLQVQIERLRNQLDQPAPTIREKKVDDEVEVSTFYNDDVPTTAGSEPTTITRFPEPGASEEDLRRMRLEFERDKRSLHQQIKALQGELLHASNYARYLRESACRAKRQAANTVSPARFGDLIMSLESMRDKLSVMERETQQQKEQNDWLKRHMEANKRHMELERQFLPLLRQARGPLGRKEGVRSVTDLKDPPWVVEEQQMSTISRKLPKMASSHSVGALNAKS